MLTGKQVALSMTTPRGPSENEKPGRPSLSTFAARKGLVWYPPTVMSAIPAQKGASPSRHHKRSSSDISATTLRARSRWSGIALPYQPRLPRAKA